MKKMLLTLMAMVTMTISAQAITFNEARREAFFLTDKMAYELNLSYSQYEAVYEINLDYLTALAVSDDIFGFYWERRNEDLSFVLSTYQYHTYMAREYFYRPVYWQSGFTLQTWPFSLWPPVSVWTMWNIWRRKKKYVPSLSFLPVSEKRPRQEQRWNRKYLISVNSINVR